MRTFIGSLFLTLLGTTSWAAGTTYYMSLTGSDSSNGTSWAQAVLTSTKAWTLMTPGNGDTLIVGDGVYSSHINLSSPTYGNAANWTVIKASTTRGVVITQSDWMSQSGTPGDMYVEYRGFISSGTFQKTILGNYLKFRQGTMYGGPTSGTNVVNTDFGGTGIYVHHNLIEDYILYGPGGRYNLLWYRSHNNIARRVIIRHDGGWPTGGNPEAAYTVYSTYDTDSQNVFIIGSTGTYTTWSQAMYNVNADTNNVRNKWQGNAIVRNTASGFTIDANATDHVIENSIFWDNTQGCVSFGNTNTSISVTQITCGRSKLAQAANVFGGFGAWGNMAGSTFRDIIVTGYTSGDDFQGMTPTYTDTYNNQFMESGATIRTFNPFTNGLTYLPRIESGSVLESTGSSNGTIGAILKEYGATGTLWGDTGYESVVSNNVFSNTNFIETMAAAKTAFGDYQARDFAAPGSTDSLCSWMYSYLGYNVPAGVCAEAAVDTSSPTAPTSLSTTAVSASTLDISWSPSTDDTGVTDYRVDASTDNFVTKAAGYNDVSLGAGNSGTLSGLTASMTYQFRLRAKDAAGNTSVNSSAGTGTTGANPVTPPAVYWGTDVDTMTIAPARLGSYVMTGGVTASTTNLVTELTHAVAAGIGIVQMNMDNWTETEPSSGTFSWDYMDRVVAIVTGTAVNQFGLEMMVTIPAAPSWQCDRFVSTSTLNPFTGAIGPATHYPTKDMGLVRRWCSNFATRYGGSIKYYQVWNEPDFKSYWIDGASTTLYTNTTNYILFLSTAHDAITAADPDAQIVLGGIAFPTERTFQLVGSTIPYNGGHWFHEMLLNGATPYFDIVGIHAYFNSEGGNLTPEIVMSTVTSMWNAVMPGTTPRFWVTEFGYNGGSYTLDPTTEEYVKANTLYRCYSVYLSTGVERVFWQVVRAVGAGNLGDYAMMDVNFVPRNVYYAHKGFYNHLNGYTFAGTDNSGNRVGTKWTKGTSTRYIYGTNSGSGSIGFPPVYYKGTKTDPYGTQSTIWGSNLGSYPVGTEYFLLDPTPPKQRSVNNSFKNTTIR